jgi:hypothetical protein
MYTSNTCNTTCYFQYIHICIGRITDVAGQVLGRWTSPSAGFLEDIVVECGERVTELCPKFVRGHGIRFST